MNAEVQQHETLQDVPGGRTQQRLVQECHVDGAECEVMAHIMPALAERRDGQKRSRHASRPVKDIVLERRS
jgi:hypothetical protein